MLGDLVKAARKAENHEADDFILAAKQLIANQFLYAEKTSQRSHYFLVTEHLEYFRNLFEAIGWNLVYQADEAFVGILPGEDERTLRLKLDESLFLLVMRQLYEEKLESFEVESGRAYVDLDKLLQSFEHLTSKELPNETRMKDILALFARHGIIERGKPHETDPKNFTLVIQPVIRQVVVEDYLGQLEQLISDEDGVSKTVKTDEASASDDAESDSDEDNTTKVKAEAVAQSATSDELSDDENGEDDETA
ncbi:DUF4194 domain-containing protein [Pokkaliibacter sp. CJK22405]|uniref:DUF4194 domain-containing protein n=1 Tax=Pokkaliibacter sp. CJK22405 TaxID=3384615 RepID=UPI0039850384